MGRDGDGFGVGIKVPFFFLLLFKSSFIAFFSNSEHSVSSTIASLGMF